MKDAKRGVLLFAHNNSVIDYSKLAIMSAVLVKKNLETPHITLVTDHKTYSELGTRFSKYFDNVIDDTIITDVESGGDRQYKDVGVKVLTGPFNNTTRLSAYDLTPYNETLVLDIDYLVMDRSLNQVWGSIEDFRMNKKVVSIYGSQNPNTIHRVEDLNIPLYWATAFYFKKTKQVEKFFTLAKYIRENYDYYSLIYRFPSSLYRNDYVFSIANHLMSNLQETDPFIKSLPVDKLLFAWDTDRLHGLIKDSLIFEARTSYGAQTIPVKVNGINVHVMNKPSLEKHAMEIIERFYG